MMSVSMTPLSQTVTINARAIFHSVCGDAIHNCEHTSQMENDKNGGPNHLRAWREHRGLTQSQLAESVGTNANMIHYLEKGERSLSARWMRDLSRPLHINPGWLIDVDPTNVDSDILDIFGKADPRTKVEIITIANALVSSRGN